MIAFFLKADSSEPEARVRIFAEQSNGFIGLADAVVQQAYPHLWTRFCDELTAYGMEAAEAEARENGEFRLARPVEEVAEDIASSQDKLEALEAELKISEKAQSVPEPEPEPEKQETEPEPEKKSKAKSKPKSKAKVKRKKIISIEDD